MYRLEVVVVVVGGGGGGEGVFVAKTEELKDFTFSFIFYFGESFI